MLKTLKKPGIFIRNWMRNRETIEFLGIWERLHNPNFNPVEFDGFRSQAGLNAFTMSPTKWIEGVNAIGIVTKAGRYGGTYAHSDIKDGMDIVDFYKIVYNDTKDQKQ